MKSIAYRFSFWMEIEMDRVGDVEIEVTATIDNNRDISLLKVLLNGDEVSDQIGERNMRIIDEKAEEVGIEHLFELRKEHADWLAAEKEDALLALWESKREGNK